MSYTYATYSAALAEMMVVPVDDVNFQAILPSVIDYAEQRIYRELDLFSTNITNSSASTSANNRAFTLPTNLGTFIVVDYINIITPAGTAASAGTRVPLTPASRDYIDFVYPSSTTGAGVPEFFAMVDPTSIIMGPSPGAAYVVEVIGTIRPTALSANNETTPITTYIPDVFLAASMVFASGYMRNFGSQADDPKMSQSWEAQYQLLKASANAEQVRQRFESWGWSSGSVSKEAAIPRSGQ